MTLKEACKSALTILKQVMEEKLNSTNVEVNLKLVWLNRSFTICCEIVTIFGYSVYVPVITGF